MDKAPSLSMVVVVVLSGTIGGFLASCYRPVLLVVVVAFEGLFFAVQYAALLDSAAGAELRAAAGAFYTAVSWSGPFLVLAGALVGLVLRRRIRTSR